MRTANPTLSVFNRPQSWDDVNAPSRSRVMTMSGTIFASAALLGVTAGVGTIVFSMLQSPGVDGGPAILSSMTYPALIGSAIGTLILAIVIHLKPRTSPVLGFVFAGGEGVFVGAFSLVVATSLEGRFGGAVGIETVFQAIGLTFGIFAAMLIGYWSGVLRFGQVVKNCIMAATGGIMLFYLAAMALSFFGVGAMVNIISFQNSSPMSIGFSLFVVVIASLNLVLDFEFIEKGVKNKAPKYMEWYAAFALLVTLVWLYVEVLRLLAKLRGRD